MTRTAEPPTESTSLLDRTSTGSRERPTPSRALGLLARRDVLCLLTLQFLTNFAYYHLLAPRLRVLELHICRTYYLDHDSSVITDSLQWPGYDIDESLCKRAPIQQKLSSLRGIGQPLEAVVVLLLSIPYGYLADRYGRKLVYSLSHTGLILSTMWLVIVCTFYDTFPVDAVLAASAFILVGGGSNVQIAIALTMGVDISGKEQSSTILYWLLATYYLGYISGNGLAPATMRYLWLPFALSIISWILALMLTWLMPYEPQASLASEADEHVDGAPRAETLHRTNADLVARLRSAISDALIFIRTHSKLVVLVLLFPLMAVRGPVIELILPYVSKRYHWSLGQAGFLDAVSGTVALILAFLVLPALVEYLKQRRGFSSHQADSIIFKYSIVALGLGALIVAIAPKIGYMIAGYILYATGAGGRMALLSIATAMVEPHQLARLNTIVVTAEVCADLSIWPVMWHLWSVALDKEDPAALGIPFYVVTGLMVVIGSIFVWNMGRKDTLGDQRDEE